MKNGCSICGGRIKARGLCNRHYKQALRAGSVTAYQRSDEVQDLPGEEWREVPGADRIMVSSAGRLKSVRRGGQLLKLRVLPSSAGQHLGALVTMGSGTRRIVLAKSVLAAFHGPASGAYTRVHYIDDDFRNCRRDNLRWADDADYFLPRAMTALLLSDHPDSGRMMAFLAGDKEALYPILLELSALLPLFVARLARERERTHYIDTESIAQEALIDGIVCLRRGKIPQIEKLRSWWIGVAKKRFLQEISRPREILFAHDFVEDNADDYQDNDSQEEAAV